MRDQPGRLHRAWRDLAVRAARSDPASVTWLAQHLGLAEPENVFDRLGAGQGTEGPIMAAAEMAARVIAAVPAAERAPGEILGLMLADVALAQKLGWRVPMPLLGTAMLHASLKTGPERRRLRPGEPGWAAACHAAYAVAAGAAHSRAIDLARRAERLVTFAQKVRTKGGAAGIGAILADEAVGATALGGLGSDRAARRFLERLTSLGAVRELTGRATFRLYGL